MIRKIALTASALALCAGAAFAATAHSELEDIAFAHEGPFGKFDQMQLQRGLQVFTEVCSACHDLKYVPIRTLADEGWLAANVATPGTVSSLTRRWRDGDAAHSSV